MTYWPGDDQRWSAFDSDMAFRGLRKDFYAGRLIVIERKPMDKPTEPPIDINRIEYAVLSLGDLTKLAIGALAEVAKRFERTDRRCKSARIAIDVLVMG